MEPFGLIVSKWHRRWYAIESELYHLDEGLFSATTTCCKYFDYRLCYLWKSWLLCLSYGDVSKYESQKETKEAEVIRFVRRCSMSVWSCLVKRRLDQPVAYENMDLQARTLGRLSTARMLLCWIVLRRLLRVFCTCLVYRTYQTARSGHP
jgi:hypothetical protein